MDDYPASYVARPLPLFFLSGLGVDVQLEETPTPLRNGPRIVCGSPLVTGDFAAQLLTEFLKFDPDQAPREAKNAQGDARTVQIKIKPIGRTYELPCRKASPAPRSPGSPLSPPILHSSLSPLSPSSPLYSDGIMHPLWNTKYQELVPSVFVSFFRFSSDPSGDDSLKTELNSLKASLTEHYRIRLAVVLVGVESALLRDTTTEDRLVNIRKATKLDSKTSFFYAAPEMAESDLASFVQSIMLALRPISQEFYRDLTKHSRRKKDRWGGPAVSPPQENPLTRSISKSGWVARYEYKMGVFAEFRFEMDAASRHFFAALDALYDSDGVFEKLSNWSPRWNEVRLFADTIAIRQIRCLLANGMPMATSRFWIKYRDTTRYLLDRRGKGTLCYGWKAWEARWARIMAELIQGSTSFAIDLIARKSLEGVTASKRQVYVDADRDQSTDESFEPWDLLHHGGYWLVLSANLTAERRMLAHSMPEEDRVPPGQSPATRVARRHETYDTYLCPESHMEYPDSGATGFDYCTEIVGALQAAMTEFAQREQIRMADVLRLRMAKELAEASRADEALSVLKPLWQRHTWRKPHWPGLVEDVASTLYSTAERAGDANVQISAMWELLGFDTKQGVRLDLMNLASKASKADTGNSRENVHVVKLTHQEISSFLDVSFSFGHGEAHASEPMRAQITISSKANSSSAPMVFTNLAILFDGTIQRISIDHVGEDIQGDANPLSKVDVSSIELRQTTSKQSSPTDVILTGSSDLTVHPDNMKIINLTMVPREAGNIKAISAQGSIQVNDLEVRYSKDLRTETDITYWWLGNAGKPRKRLALRNPGLVIIHPKLPKVKLNFTNIRDRYYTDERIVLELDIINEEAAEVDVTLEFRAPGHEGQVFNVQEIESDTSKSESSSHITVLSHRLGAMSTGMLRKMLVTLQAPSNIDKLAFEAKAVYALESPLSNTSSVELNVTSLFKPQYTINPDLHLALWPSFFYLEDHEGGSGHSPESAGDSSPLSTSIIHRWKLKVDLTSLATDNVLVRSIGLDVLNVGDGAKCALFKESENAVYTTFTPKTQHTKIFRLDTQRVQLEDLRTTNVEAALRIEWSRINTRDNATSITTIPTPRLIFPSSEPRVLVSRTASDQKSIPINLILENPSMHFLSFNVSLEPDEGFAFSGPKLALKHVAPMSRHTLRYNILPLDWNTPIRPEFKVVDIHFNKSLHINPTGNIQSDDRGIFIMPDT